MALASLETWIDTDELQSLNEHFHAAPPQDLLAWAADRWGDRVALTCSFGGAAGMVLLDMLVAVAPDVPVLFLDTGLLFPETYRVAAAIKDRYGIVPRAIEPAETVEQQAAREGDALWAREPDRCCELRKVRPLAQALVPSDAWITGVRREGARTRANAQLIEWSPKYNLFKLNPLAYWSEREVWNYIFKHDVPYNPLLDQGYRSLGCHTCTRLPVSDDPRSGRWAGFNKTECGLHI